MCVCVDVRVSISEYMTNILLLTNLSLSHTHTCRFGKQPDGICIVVGTCASGFDPEKNTYADLLYSNTPTLDKGSSQVQYFWLVYVCVYVCVCMDVYVCV